MGVCSVVSSGNLCRSVTPSQWENFSNQNILKAEKERNASSTLRGVIRGVLDQTLEDMLRQRAVVDQAFDQQIRETTEAKEKLEEHLAKVIHCYTHPPRAHADNRILSIRCIPDTHCFAPPHIHLQVNADISSMEANISALEMAISDKRGPYMLAHSRLNTRSQRPNVELVHDPPQQRLIQEVGEIAGERAHFTGGYCYIQTCKEMIGVNIKLDRIPLSVCIAQRVPISYRRNCRNHKLL